MTNDLTVLTDAPADKHWKFSWSALESELGIPLPADYKMLMDIFGPGIFNDFIYVLHPSSDFNYDMIEQRDLLRDVVRDLDEVLGAPFPAESLLPWAITISGEICYWRIDAESPDAWTTVITDNSPDYEIFAGAASDFLYGVLSGDISCGRFEGEHHLMQAPFFRPFLKSA